MVSHSPTNSSQADTMQSHPTSTIQLSQQANVPTGLFAFIYNHTQSESKKVITKVNWEIIPDLSSPEIATHYAKIIFEPSIYWKNKDFLYETLNVFGTKSGFTPRSLHSSSFGCNRCGKQRIRSKNGSARTTASGSLQVSCTWSFCFASKIKITSQDKKTLKFISKNSFTEHDIVYISTKNPKYSHKFPCTPSISQVMYTNRASGKYVTNISEMATYTLITLLKGNPTLSSSVIRSLLKPNFPERKVVTNNDIYNSKMRCYRLMDLYENCNADFNKFVTSIKQTKNLEGIDYEAEHRDLSMKMSHDIWNEILSNSEHAQLSDNSWSMHAYMEMMEAKCKGFTFRLAHGTDGGCNGVLWMTPSMRENFRRFGSFISLDAMKRGINTFLWHYFSVVMVDDNNCNCLAAEGIIVSEREDAYNFIIQSTLSMGMGVRENTEIYCVAGDGIFNQNSLQKWGLPNAQYMTDQWHLINHTLPKQFGKNIFDYIYTHLKSMCQSHSEDVFNSSYHKAKTQLLTLLPRNIVAEQQLETFASQKSTYARFMLRKIRGSLSRVGSCPSEQNHASVLCFLNDGVKGENRYCADPHILIQDLILRLKGHIERYDHHLANATNQLKIIYHNLNQSYTSGEIDDTILLDASNMKISLTAYNLFKIEYNESHNYIVSNNSDNCIEVQRIDSNAPPRIFNDINDKCNCDTAISWMIQCRHKIKTQSKFNIDNFDIRHHYRPHSDVCIRVTDTPVSSYHYDEDNDSSSHNHNDNYNDTQFTQTSVDTDIHVGNESTNSSFTIDPSSSVATEINKTTYVPIGTTDGPLDIRGFLSVQSECAGKYKQCPKDIKMFLCGTQILLKDIASRGATNTMMHGIDSSNNIDLCSSMTNIISNYNNMFASKHNSFAGANITPTSRTNVLIANKGNKNMLSCQPKKRLMTDQERAMRHSSKRKSSQLSPLHNSNKLTKVRPRIQKIRTCTFCKTANHNASNCVKRNRLKAMCSGRELKNTTGKQSLLEAIKSGPRSVLDTSKNYPAILHGLLTTTKPTHIIIHTSYTKDGIFQVGEHWSMGNMMFSVSIVGDNGEINNDYHKVIITGEELEHFIRQNLNSSSKYIYDMMGAVPHNFCSQSTLQLRRCGMSQDPPGERFNM